MQGCEGPGTQGQTGVRMETGVGSGLEEDWCRTGAKLV